MWDDAVPLQRHQVVRLIFEQALLELPDDLLALLDAGRPALLVVERVERRVLVIAVVRRIAAAREELVHVEVGLDDVPALEVHRRFVLALAERCIIGGRLDHALRDVEAHLAPLVDHPYAERLVRHRDAAVGEGERKALGNAGLLEQAPRLGA